ncbi:PKD domain-containing protein [bacterium]|nr:PKD domain-containing protein [bacterium]
MKKTILTLLVLFTASLVHAQCSNFITSFTVQNSAGCDSTVVQITNTSNLPFDSVLTFEWDFGDGNELQGDATDSVLYEGVNKDGVISYTYRNNGTFNITLTIEDVNGCTESYTVNSAVTNIAVKPSISHTLNNREACFSVSNLPNPSLINTFLWNFGDPPAGPMNFDDESFTPCHNYGGGPWMASLRIIVGSCDITVFDTIQVEGPFALIEVPFGRIADDEKYQCTANKLVNFPNNSTFYHNDNTPEDEDSTIILNGKSVFAFNYNETTKVGDQTHLASLQHLNNRGDENVYRIWDFGDPYAPQCTTNTAAGIFPGMNCNFSVDSTPSHWYKTWDSAYVFHRFDTFCAVVYNDSTQSCSTIQVDESMTALHREIFNKTIIKPYKVTLTLTDTVSGRESRDTVDIVIGPADASRLEISSGIACPYDGNNLDYILEFDMNTGSQSYFAVNFDSIAGGGFNAFNSGAVLAPPKPGSPIPFVLPYSISGTYGDQFIKGYTPGEVGQFGLRDPEGSFTIGLIVGNGPLQTNGLPTCLDTVWYHDMFRIKALDASFDIVSPNRTPDAICVGEEVYFKLNTEKQRDISSFRLNYGDVGFGKTPDKISYFETFYYLEDYTGPVSGRNDENINYNGEDWKYNYVVRSELDRNTGVTVLDTIVTAIIKDWKELVSYDGAKAIRDALAGQNCYADDLKDVDLVNLLGSCIDTTGLSELFPTLFEEYSTDDEGVYRIDNKRFRYTNDLHTDSIEVAEILHFRDSSLQGFDTLIIGTDTTFGVWKHKYTYLEVNENGDSFTRNATGPMTPNLILTNTKGCIKKGAVRLNVGVLAEFSIEDNGICEGLTVFLNDSVRYWQYGDDSWPFDYPIDPRDFWNNPDRFVNNIETIEYDWDATDGQWDGERMINPSHIYDNAGDYVITIAVKDSLGCFDTSRIDISISGIEPSFTVDDQSTGCFYQVQFENTTTISGDTNVQWTWRFGDGQSSTEENPVHTYTQAGNFEIKLVVYTSAGCYDSTSQTVSISNNSTLNSPAFSYSVNDLSINSENKGSTSLQYIWNWGDNSDSDTAFEVSHTYSMEDDYTVCLTARDVSTGCTADSCITVAVGNCNAYFTYSADTADFTVRLHDSSTGSNLSYLWYWGDGDSSTATQPSHEYDEFGLYEITLQVSNTNCVSIYSDSVGMDSFGNVLKMGAFKVIVGEGLGIKDLDPGNVHLYPNPVSDILNVNVSKGYLERINVYTIDGKKVNADVTEKAGNSWKISLPETSGTYIIEVITDRGSFRQQVIKN